jgi:hypothetical protein
LFENSGADKSSGGGYEYNLNKQNQLHTDSLGKTISYLGIKNIDQFPYVKDPQLDPRGNTNYAFYVDTAFINRGTGWIKPQYMLAVDTLTVLPCQICNPEYKWDKYRGYIIGRYLYNTSMYAKKLDPTFNPALNYDSTQIVDVDAIRPAGPGAVDGYAYTRSGSTKFERLAFAWAIHRGDSLIVLKNVPTTKADGERFSAEDVRDWLIRDYPATSGSNVDFETMLSKVNRSKSVNGSDKIGVHAVIELGDKNGNRHSDWVFSFRYIQRDADDFIVESETAYKPGSAGAVYRDIRRGLKIRPEYGGWVKYDNNVPTITRSDSREVLGEGYIMNVTFSDYQPVSNDPVEGVTSDVKVIGGDGVVAILNAAGKSVVITNALGQKLANIVAGSDNVSVPVASSGIVFVSVDGGKAVKALVK